MNVKAVLGVLVMACVWSAQAACPTDLGRFAANGAEVTDSKTGLVWARCSVGQVWDGSTCTGSASSHTHEQALSLAQSAIGWRLPNVKELSSIVDKGCMDPAIDSAAFPNTPSRAYWSSTPSAGNVFNAWYVIFLVASSGPAFRDGPFAVRLVRVGP